MSDPTCTPFFAGLLLAADEGTGASGRAAIPDAVRLFLMVVLGTYFVGLFALSVRAARRVRDEEDYLVAGRRLPLFLTWGTLVGTWFGAETVTGTAEAARDEGLRGTILDPFACSAALVVAGLFFAKPLWRLKLLTISDVFRRCYGPTTEKVAGVAQVVGSFGWIAAQYVALAAVLETYFDVDPRAGIPAATLIVLAFTLIGGMWSVTVTDTVQIVLAFAGLLVLAFATLSSLGAGAPTAGWSRLIAEVDPDKWSLLPKAGLASGLAYVGTWASGVFGNLPGQDVTQRISAADGPRTARRACVLAGVTYLAFGMIPVGLGLASTVSDPGEQPGTILQFLAGKYLAPGLAVVFVTSFVSIVVSTATSAVLAPATILAHTLLGGLRPFRDRALLLDRTCVALVAVAGMGLAATDESILELLDLSLGITFAALFVPFVMALFGRPRGSLPGLLAVVCGLLPYVPRWALEEIVLKLPQQGFDGGYDDFLAATFPDHAAVARLYGLVPASLQGLLGSLAGYCAGQWRCRRELPVNDAIRRQAFDARDDDGGPEDRGGQAVGPGAGGTADPESGGPRSGPRES